MKTYKVKVNDKVYEVQVESVTESSEKIAAPAAAPVQQAAPSAAPAGGQAVNAPMAGTINDVKVAVGQAVKKGDVLADGQSMEQGELALGRNVVIAFMTWHGYNFEDAVIMSERMVQDDVYTSIHIEEYTCEARDTKLGKEVITRDLEGEAHSSVQNLDENGIVILGSEVKEGDTLVGKLTPKGLTEPSPEERLSQALFADNSKEVRISSLKVPHGGSGIVNKIERFNRKSGAELPPGVNEVVRVYIVQKRKISEISALTFEFNFDVAIILTKPGFLAVITFPSIDAKVGSFTVKLKLPSLCSYNPVKSTVQTSSFSPGESVYVVASNWNDFK